MHSSKIFEKNIPYLLPFLLMFYRGLADFTVLFIGILFIYRSYKNSDWLWVKEPWFKMSLIFVFYLLSVNVFISIDSKDSFFYAITFIRWPIFAAALAYWLFKQENSIKKFLLGVLVVVAFFVFDVWYQFFQGEDIFGYEKYSPTRLTGPLRNNPVVGIFITKYLYILLTSVIIFNKFSNNSSKIFTALFLFFIGFVTVFITGERMSFILFTSSILIISLAMPTQIKSKLLIIFGFFIILIAITLMIGSYFPLVSERALDSSLDKILHFSNSDYGQVFRAGYLTWLGNPMLGGGLHQFNVLYPLYDSTAWAGMLHPHNHPLSLLAETGVIGLLLFYTLIFSIVKNSLAPMVNKKKWFSAALCFNLLYLCFFPFMTHFSFQHNWMNATNWLIVGLVLAISKRHDG